jgi:mRNA interferase MazF
VRTIHLVRLDKIRPALVLTRSIAVPHLSGITVAPITTTIRGLATEVPVGSRNNLDHDCVVHCDSIQTIPRANLLAPIGLLLPDQEDDLARAIRAAFDLDS